MASLNSEKHRVINIIDIMALIAIGTLGSFWQFKEYSYRRTCIGYALGLDPTRWVNMSIPVVCTLCFIAMYFELKKTRNRLSEYYSLGSISVLVCCSCVIIKSMLVIIGKTIKNYFGMVSAIENESFATTLTPRLTETGIYILVAWIVVLYKTNNRSGTQQNSTQKLGLLLGVIWIIISIIEESTKINNM
jgi:hypothetical protein